MKIPRDLKPGDRLWYSEKEYATITPRPGETNPYCGGYVRAMARGRFMWYHLGDGVEIAHETKPIIRIERIASAKPKRVKVDKDAKWLRKQIECFTGFTPYGERRLRAIARRLEQVKGDQA